jgi:hypothetical protein
MTSGIRGMREKRYNRARYVPRCTRIPAGVFRMRQVIRMSKVIRLETGEEPEWFFDLEQEKSPQDSSTDNLLPHRRETTAGLPGGSSLRVFARIVHRSINQEKFPEHSTIGSDAGKFPALMKIFGKNLRKKKPAEKNLKIFPGRSHNRLS